MIAPDTLDGKTTYINVIGKFKPRKTMFSPYHYDTCIYDYIDTPTVETAQENRKWENKFTSGPLAEMR